MVNLAKQIYHRRSIRLKGYDYASEGLYFVTIVTFQRQHLFGEVVNGDMKLNAFGRIAREEWFKTQALRPNVELDEDEFVVMPNHVHGIIWLHEDEKDAFVGKGTARNPTPADGYGTGDLQATLSPKKADNLVGKGTARRAPTSDSFGHPITGSLATIVGAYKSAVTKQINRMRGFQSVSVWHRNYYDPSHFVRGHTF